MNFINKPNSAIVHFMAQKNKHDSTFLLWIASANTSYLEDNPSEISKFKLIGLSILFTWIFATAVWAYFFTTVVDSIFIAGLGGLLMGLIVLTIDRVLIAGIQGVKIQSNPGPILFRFTLALCLGAFMAQPALLYLFKKDIDVQLSLDKEIKKQAVVAQIKTSFKPQLDPLYKRQDSLATIQDSINQQLVNLRTDYLKESDGSGGTGKIGIADIAKAKKLEYDLALSQKNQFTNNVAPTFKTINSQIDSLTLSINQKIKNYDQQAFDGFLARIDALKHLLDTNPALKMRYLLLLLIILLIELAPVLSKLMLQTPVYNQRSILQEGLLLELDREIYEKKFKEAQKYAESVHQSNISAINEINDNSPDLRKQLNQDPIIAVKMKEGNKDVDMTSIIQHLKSRILGKHS